MVQSRKVHFWANIDNSGTKGGTAALEESRTRRCCAGELPQFVGVPQPVPQQLCYQGTFGTKRPGSRLLGDEGRRKQGWG